MKTLSLNELELIQGGGFFSGFCRGVQAATVVYGAGIVANLWNPVGGGSAVALGVINAACIFA